MTRWEDPKVLKHRIVVCRYHRLWQIARLHTALLMSSALMLESDHVVRHQCGMHLCYIQTILLCDETRPF